MEHIVYERDTKTKKIKEKIFKSSAAAAIYIWSFKPSEERSFFQIPYKPSWSNECKKLANKWFDSYDILLDTCRKENISTTFNDIFDRKFSKKIESAKEAIFEIKADSNSGFKKFLKSVEK